MLKLPKSVNLTSAPIPNLVVKNALAEAVICLQGAQVMHFAPAGQAPLLWAAERRHWIAGKNLRGGVPICWPWFGPHKTDAALPQHGWVRQREWQLIEACDLPDGRTQLAFTIVPEKELPEWPETLLVSLEVTIGKTLTLALTTSNFGEEPVKFEDALHTYFAVSDVRGVGIRGFQGASYADQLDGMKPQVETADPAKISGPTCHIFSHRAPLYAIEDPAMNRRIAVEPTHSGSSVLWNPGEKTAASMVDLGEAWTKMVCLETANCHAAAITLAPGESHTTGVVYGAAAL